MSEDRFKLDAIDKQRASIERAKQQAQEQKHDPSTGRLMALTNLPWLIALLGFLWWKYH
ncbi:hypothetical protein SAMN02745857_02718 [Andreprevotia lacus DSM 23236]|uniref:Uncharacterized protein n=1 Tax=Andreprevotia lacus DSM 23236 TaxID=1121001 RepID=A0A1W1XTC2_9NEIS|nr:hypothetical protein [Andreprevotia lacus]SMC27095.1 hypothetical protein SAMN02745857_02718 [Andreprevotia lacus DSM 23236]